MLSVECLRSYHNQFPEDECGYNEPGSGVMISHKDKLYIEPENETDRTFMERLKRCRSVGQNLFYREWDSFEYDPDYIY